MNSRRWEGLDSIVGESEFADEIDERKQDWKMDDCRKKTALMQGDSLVAEVEGVK